MSEYSPPTGFYFKASFTGPGLNSELSFQEVSGLSANLNTEEVTEGGELNFRHRLPTTPKYSNLILKRGLITDRALLDWIQKGLTEFSFTPVTMSIILSDQTGKPLMTWKIYKAWPVKWEVSNIDAMKKQLAVESLEIAFDYFERV